MMTPDQQVTYEHRSLFPDEPRMTRTNPTDETLRTAYEELCKSYHAIDDFRMKLLGLLPLASLAGVFLLNREALVAGSPASPSKELIAFGTIFAALFTAALFFYELRGIRRCHNLIEEGLHLEKQLGLGHGQFYVCTAEHNDPGRITSALNAKFAACTIYSLVFTAWFFSTLRFGFDVHTQTCALSAVLVGSILAVITCFVVRRLTST
jgi:hypothetical protein